VWFEKVGFEDNSTGGRRLERRGDAVHPSLQIEVDAGAARSPVGVGALFVIEPGFDMQGAG
jgi:hypothetical protein